MQVGREALRCEQRQVFGVRSAVQNGLIVEAEPGLTGVAFVPTIGGPDDPNWGKRLQLTQIGVIDIR